jgi:hypothetical protein
VPEQRKLGAVAQLVAHLHGMQGVRGSSPLSSTKKPLELRAAARFRRFFFAEIQHGSVFARVLETRTPAIEGSGSSAA